MKKHLAKTWDKWYKKGVKWDSNKPSKNIIKFKEYLRKKDRILDLGCGQGRDVIYLAKLGFDSYGIDISKVAIKKIKKRCGAKNLHAFVGNSEKLPFENNFFDAVYCGWVLEYTNIKKSISEIERVVKKYGIVYLVFWLNSKLIKTGKINYTSKEKEIMPHINKFKLLKKEKYYVLNSNKKSPRKSKILVLILKK